MVLHYLTLFISCVNEKRLPFSFFMNISCWILEVLAFVCYMLRFCRYTSFLWVVIGALFTVELVKNGLDYCLWSVELRFLRIGQSRYSNWIFWSIKVRCIGYCWIWIKWEPFFVYQSINYRVIFIWFLFDLVTSFFPGRLFILIFMNFK